MAPILFLILMLAFTDMLEEEYEKERQVKPWNTDIMQMRIWANSRVRI